MTTLLSDISSTPRFWQSLFLWHQDTTSPHNCGCTCCGVCASLCSQTLSSLFPAVSLDAYHTLIILTFQPFFLAHMALWQLIAPICQNPPRLSLYQRGGMRCSNLTNAQRFIVALARKLIQYSSGLDFHTITSFLPFASMPKIFP